MDQGSTVDSQQVVSLSSVGGFGTTILSTVDLHPVTGHYIPIHSPP